MNFPKRLEAVKNAFFVIPVFCLILLGQGEAIASTVVGWGDPTWGVPTPPAGLTNAVAIAAGAYHVAALKNDGTVVTWGNNEYGQATTPAGLSNVTAIVAGWDYNLALKNDGTLTFWGDTYSGEEPPPAGLSNVITISTSCGTPPHNLALKNDGTLVGWGDNAYAESVIPAGLSNVVAVAAGVFHSLVLKSDGTVAGWGYNEFGQATSPNGLSNVVAIAAGPNYSMALKNDGTLFAWGAGFNGETNIPPGLSNVVAISAGLTDGLALKSDGTIVEWGYNLTGQTNVPGGVTNVTAIASGAQNGLALVNPGPPAILWQSFNQTSYSGYTLSLGVGAVGPQPLFYQWQLNGTNVSGATNATLILTNVQSVNAGIYSVTVTNQNGTTSATNATVTVINSPPIMISQPTNQLILLGGSVAVQATGSLPLSYQWQLNGTNIPGATAAILQLTNVQWGGVGTYDAVVSNAYGTASTSNILLNVIDLAHALDAPGFIWTTSGDALWSPETNVTEDGVAAAESGAITNGQQVSLQTSIVGPGTLTYWWKVSSQTNSDHLEFFTDGVLQGAISGEVDWEQETNYLGAGSQTVQWIYAKDGAGSSGQDAGWVDEVVFTPGGTGAILASSPTNETAFLTANVTFGASAQGTPPLLFQWQFNGTNIGGATNAAFTLTNVLPGDDGNYSVVVSNAYGMAASSNVSLYVQSFIGWGDNIDEVGNYAGEAVPPAYLTNVAAISAWGYHSMALKNDGTVVGWGDNTQGQSAVPNGLSNVVGIAAGYWHSLALKNDGTVIAWGNNYNISGTYQGEVTVPTGLTNVMAIAAGGDDNTGLSLALKNDGTVMGWGATTVPAGLSNVVAISAGGEHCLALRSDGTMSGWGYNYNGQATPPAGLTNIVAVAAGGFHSLALRSDGTVVAWGNNYNGQTNVPAGLTNVAAIAAGEYFSLALKSDGTMVEWGDNSDGESSVPPGLNHIVAIAGGAYHSLALLNIGNPCILQQPLNRTLYSGLNTIFYTSAFGSLPLSLQWQQNGTNLSGATNLTLFLTNLQPANAGTYALIASNSLGMISSFNATLTVVTSPPILTSQPTNVSAFGGGTVNFSAGTTGSVPMSYQWQFDGTNLTGATNAMLSFSNLQWSSEGVYSLIISNQYGVIVSSNAVLAMPRSQVVAWGGNLGGETNVPAGLTNIVSIAAGAENSLAIKPDGTFVGWGYNGWGETATPSGLSNVVGLASSSSMSFPYSLALRSDGTVFGWGNNNGGQTNVPAGLTNVVAIGAGQLHGLALRNDGKVFAWGNNSSGQTNVPASITNATAIAAGWSFNLAVQSNGKITSWGDNTYGQTNVPPGLTNVVAIAAGQYHCVALRSDGTVLAWGNNASGQTNVPAGLTNVVAIAAGASHSLAVRSDGSVVAWGMNSFLQTNVPAGLNQVVLVAGGSDHSLALREGGPLIIPGQPIGQSVNAGANLFLRTFVIGGNPISYQWQFNGTNIDGATNETLTMLNVQPVNAGDYTLTASNGYGAIISSNAVLTVNTYPPAFVNQPTNAIALTGSNVTLFATVAGTSPLSYQWLFDGTNLTGATNASLIITNFQSSNQGTYNLSVTNLYGSVVSSNANLSLLNLGVALNATNLGWTTGGNSPWFPETKVDYDGIAAAQTGAINSGQTSTLQTTVIGPGTLSFWWEISSSGFLFFSINGSTVGGINFVMPWQQQTYYLGAGAQSLNWNYSGVSFGFGSNAAWLDEVIYTPGGTGATITTSPASQSVGHGTNVSFSAAVYGTPPLAYQWRFNSNNIAGSTNAVLTLAGVQATNSGAYSVVVTNAYGSAVSSNAILIVRSPQFNSSPASLNMTSLGLNLQIDGLTGHGPVTIYASTNLTNWQAIFTNPATNGSLQFLDTNALVFPFQFYRATEQ